MSLMYDEINQQPDVIKTLVANELENVKKIASEIKKRDIDFVVMAARGTSDHGAIYGKYLFEIKNSLPVALADPSIFTLYDAKLKLDRALVIGVSQSGEAADVAQYLKQSKEMGAVTLSITNVSGSILTKVADYTVLCNAGVEKAVAATKTYTTTQAAFYILSAALAGDSAGADKLIKCADEIKKVLKLDDILAAKAERYRYMQAGTVLARGYNYCTALETSLKLAETCYVKMKGYSAADFLHGPIAAIHEGDPCFIFANAGKTYSMVLDTAKKLRDRDAETIIFSSEDEVLSLATNPVKLDVDIEEELSPIVNIVPAQLFAYHLSLAKGNNPDSPRGLSKVTLTR